MKTKKITTAALLAAAAVICGYIETLIPLPIPIGGVKLGLANVAVLTALYLTDTAAAFFVMLIKIFVCNLLFASPSALIYSLSGGAAAFFAMVLFKKLGFDITAVSVAGGIFHNIGQLTVGVFLLYGIGILYYLPVLMLSGIFFSVITGAAAKIAVRSMKNII